MTCIASDRRSQAGVPHSSPSAALIPLATMQALVTGPVSLYAPPPRWVRNTSQPMYVCITHLLLLTTSHLTTSFLLVTTRSTSRSPLDAMAQAYSARTSARCSSLVGSGKLAQSHVVRPRERPAALWYCGATRTPMHATSPPSACLCVFLAGCQPNCLPIPSHAAGKMAAHRSI